MSDTPRTDAFEALVNRPTNWWDFARELERENAALREALTRADLALGNLGIGKAAPVRVIARDALRKEAQP